MRPSFLIVLCLAVLPVCLTLSSFAADTPASAPENPPKLNDSREKRPPRVRPGDREEWEARREELKKLSPDQRRARIMEWRRHRIANRPEIKELTPQEKEIKRKEFRDRIAGEIAELEARKAEPGLRDHEARRLNRLKEIKRRFDQATPASKGAP